MPLFDYLCMDCGESSEILITGSADQPQCQSCGSFNLKKLLAAHSSISGASHQGVPGHGDTSCCGSTPTQAGCSGPGSCCGNRSF
ncbi:MAG: zinc ribbon domain-containing protein [Proteobacteria bacterium]|nr:zinc ribbon domain-containing protein [Pseudomonadota bacterium]MBU4388657.1 zinc ribbon domain-containing protein [Pseudomonadota bacterium]MCJ7618485.1 zinc ribbon domain-containing protein [Desulfobacterales bacterium]